MTIPHQTTVTFEVQRARSVLTELAETGHVSLSRDRHLNVLLALDNLEAAVGGVLPPPDAARNITDVPVALAEAQDALSAVLGNVSVHGVDAVRVALAREHVAAALTRTA